MPDQLSLTYGPLPPTKANPIYRYSAVLADNSPPGVFHVAVAPGDWQPCTPPTDVAELMIDAHEAAAVAIANRTLTR